MNKEKNLSTLRNNLESLQLHLNKLVNKDYKLHQIDIDLMRNKLLDAYELLNELALVLENENTKHQKTINLPEKTPKAEIPQKVSHTTAKEEALEDVTTNIEQPDTELKEKLASQLPDSQAKQPVSDENITETEEVPVPEKNNTADLQKEQVKKVVEVDQETVKTTAHHADPMPKEDEKSTIDLFSNDAEKTIADKLGSNDESSIADKMQQSQVNDLRQVIGINEKFLFINELFNGDMGKYNKVIDELNELSSQQGINAYLIELKIANRWNDENEAFVKLSKILERKTS